MRHFILAMVLALTLPNYTRSEWASDSGSKTDWYSTKESCTNVDLRNGPKGYLFKEPRDQDTTGWCFAFAAADLVSFKMGAQISAAHLSYAYSNEASHSFISRLTRLFSKKSPLPRGGFTKEAVNVFNRHGGCTEAGMPSQSRYLHLDLMKELQVWRTEEILGLDDLPLNVRCDKIEKQYSKNAALKLYFPELDLGTFEQIVLSTKEQSFVDFIYALSRNACKLSDRITTDKPLQVEGGGDTSDQLTQINEQLSRENPVGIEYQTGRFLVGDVGFHASVLIGRKWYNGACHYLIRNSFGKGCSFYIEKTTECEGESGAFWVTERDLRATLWNVTYIP